MHKPSEYTENTANLLKEMCDSAYDEEEFATILESLQILLHHKQNHTFPLRDLLYFQYTHWAYAWLGYPQQIQHLKEQK